MSNGGKNEGSNSQPEQAEMPFAIVQGAPLTELPRDLYIPPEALEIFLEAFEGPLDLLLYLIRRQNLDILDIPIVEITRQYMGYVDMMTSLLEQRGEAVEGLSPVVHAHRFELAAEYLVMAAMLAEIKSRMLLPRVAATDEADEDPRAELVRRLQEYERYKQAAQDLDSLPRMGRDRYAVHVDAPDARPLKRHPEVSLEDLSLAFSRALARAEQLAHHHVQLEPLSVRERMARVLEALRQDHFLEFSSLFSPDEGRRGVVVSFLALLELLKESLVELVQAQPFGPIHIKVPKT